MKMMKVVLSLFLKDNVGEEFNKYITKQLVITGANAVEDDKAYLIDIKKEEAALAKNTNYQRRLPLFVGEKDGKDILYCSCKRKRFMGCYLGLCCFRQ